MGVGVNFALLNENYSGDPHFLFVFLKGYIKVYEKKTLRLLMSDFLNVHSIAFYIELSSKYEGVGVNFALLKDNCSGDPHFVFFFLKGYIKVYEIKTKL